jgi:hypothetical protein
MLIRTFSSFFILLLLCQTQVIAGSVDNKLISITVPAAPWTLTLPGDNLAIEDQQIKPDGQHGYFLITDSKNDMTISLFIEPAVKCKNSKECRDMVWKLGNPSWENPQKVVLSEIGDVSFVEFFMASYRSMPVKQQNMYVELVVDGFWVDLHMSKTLYTEKEHELFERLVKSIKFEPKKQISAVRAEDSPEIAAQKALEAWVPLWDSGNKVENYKELAEYTKKFFTQEQWFVYWTAVRKPLGRLKSRKLIEASYLNSMPAGPDYEGALLRYQSSFENRKSIVEIFGMLRDKSGTWRLANYVTP